MGIEKNRVSNIVSTDGGQLLPVTKTVTGGPILETVAPVLTKAEYTDTDEIALYFDEETGLTAAAGAVEIFNGSTKVATADIATVADATAGDDGKIKVILTTTDFGGADLASLNQATLTVKVAKDVIVDTNGNKIAASSVALTDLSANVSGTLTASWNSTDKEFTTILGTTPVVEVGSTAYVYVVGATDAPITTSNYETYRTVAIQSATSLTTGITFATATDSFGAALADGNYTVYVVVKDAAGNVVDVQPAGAAVTVSGL